RRRAPDHQHRRERLPRRRRHRRAAPAARRRGALPRQEHGARPGADMSPRIRATVDDSKWPRVYVTWPGEPLEDADFEAAVLAMSKLLERGQRYVILHDARRAVRSPPSSRSSTPRARAAGSKAWRW